MKSVPASVKKDQLDDWKDLQGAAKDAEKMLGTVRDRLDGLFLARKTWPLAKWRDRYLDHPLAGIVARKLIWTIAEPGRTVEVIFDGNRLIDRGGQPIGPIDESATVSLWQSD